MITYYVAASTDNFIAGKDDDLSFLDMVEEGLVVDGKEVNPDEMGYESLYNSIDTCVMGKKTYDWVMKQGTFPYPEKDNWIMTRSKIGLGDHKEVFSDFKTRFWRKKSDEKNIWLVGGGEIAQLFLDAGLIDKLILTIIPVELKEGSPLFTRGFNRGQWTEQSSKKWDNGVSQVVFTFNKMSEN